MKVDAPPRSWTFLHYLNGDNNLREAVTNNLVRLHREGSSDQVQIVASLYRGQTELTLRNLLTLVKDVGRGAQGSASATDWRGQKTFEVRQQSSLASASSPLLNEAAAGQTRPSDWHNLRDFLVDSMRAYPAQHFAVFVSSHGAGADGLLTDCRGQRMSVDDFQRALDEAQSTTGQKISLLALECCSMGEKSIVEKLSRSVDYIIASPTPITTQQVSHESVLSQAKHHPDWSPAQLAESTYEVYRQGLPAMQLFCRGS